MGFASLGCHEVEPRKVEYKCFKIHKSDLSGVQILGECQGQETDVTMELGLQMQQNDVVGWAAPHF